jgi:hypothetical protein
MKLLCYYGGTIISTDNDITYNEGTNEFLSIRLDMSLAELKKLIYGGIK